MIELTYNRLGFLISAYWIERTFDRIEQLAPIELEMVCLGFAKFVRETVIYLPFDSGRKRLGECYVLKLSDVGRKWLEENHLLDMIEKGAFYYIFDEEIAGLISRLSKEQLPALLTSSNDRIREAAAKRFKEIK